MAQSCPDAFETKGEEIHKFVLGKVINAPSPSATVSARSLKDGPDTDSQVELDEDNEADWVEEPELEMLDRAKVISLRVLTHRALGHGKSDNKLIIVRPVFTLLSNILDGKGTVNENTNEGYVSFETRKETVS